MPTCSSSLPAAGRQRVAPRSPAAALAEAVLYFGDPNVPSQPEAAFLGLLHKVPGAFAFDTDQSLVADGQIACAGLAHEQGADEVIDALTGRGLDQFEADLVSISATENFCPQAGLQADKDVQQALNQGPGNASPRASKFS